jgi:protein arginine kinase
VKLSQIFQTSAEWLRSQDDESGIVVSSRLRLARNIEGAAFPTWAKKSEKERVLNQVFPRVMGIPEMRDAILSESMDHFSVLDKQILVEQHLISREHAARSTGSAVVVSADRSLSIMINEEDHLRMQAFGQGLALDRVWRMINQVDDELDDKLNFAFSSQYGYLTACPTNVGTGMRASVMLHLPALVLAEQINQIIQAVGKLGLAVRGLYGEGTEALGNLFQVSNQMTLGESEDELIARLTKVIQQIVEYEQKARATLLEKRPFTVADQVGRAFGVLSYCYAISSKEALNLLSVLRLGIELGAMPRSCRSIVDDLMIFSQPAHLQMSRDKKLSAEDRDALRADLLREKLSLMKSPDLRMLLASDQSQKETSNE